MKSLFILSLGFLSIVAQAGVTGSYRIVSDHCFDDSQTQVCSKHTHIEPKEIDVWMVVDDKKSSEDRLSIKYKSIVENSSLLVDKDPTAIQGYFANWGTFACHASGMECHYDVETTANSASIAGPDDVYLTERREYLLQSKGNQLSIQVRQADTKKLEREMIFIRTK